MRRMFLIGRHIGHSLSPAMWNHAFATTDTPIRYGLRDVDGDGLEAVAEEITDPAVVAANVTMPHKAWAASICTLLDEAATATGAVNLLMSTDDGVSGRNTDVVGARSILAVRAPYRSVVVVGAGGTAAAALTALAGLADHVVIVNRTRPRAEDLAERHRSDISRLEVAGWEHRDQVISHADLVVNTVPVVDEAPFDIRSMTAGALYDVIYRTQPTALQAAAIEAGVPLADGLAHLAAQAIAMLDPLGFDPAWAGLLTEGLEEATGRTVEAWGRRLV